MIKVQLDKEAIQYFDKVLSFENDVCRLARSTLTDGSPHFFSLLPTLGNIDKANKLDEGIFEYPIEINSSESRPDDANIWLAQYLYEKIKLENKYCLFDDVMASKQDVEELKDFSVQSDSGIYHVACAHNVKSKNDLLKIIYATKVSWHFVCVVAEFSSRFEKWEIGGFDINQNIVNVTELYLGAYDGDSFICAELEST